MSPGVKTVTTMGIMSEVDQAVAAFGQRKKTSAAPTSSDAIKHYQDGKSRLFRKTRPSQQLPRTINNENFVFSKN